MEPSGTEGRNVGMFNSLRWLPIFGTRRGSARPLRYSKNPSPSGMSQNPWCSSPVRPETMNVGCWKTSPGMVIAPYCDAVSSRALSTTSCSTVSKSRLSLMRRLASVRRESLFRSTSISLTNSSFLPMANLDLAN